MSAPALPPLALSVRQPWAWAIIHGGKDVENRTAHALKHLLGRLKRGPICIHASKTMSRDEYESALMTFRAAGLKTWPKPDELIRSAIIGTVTVLGTVGPDCTSPWWIGGRGLRLTAPQPLAEPWPLKGSLGYFEWDQIERHLTQVEEPLPWMRAWPGAYHPFSNAPDNIKQPEPAPLFGDPDALPVSRRHRSGA